MHRFLLLMRFFEKQDKDCPKKDAKPCDGEYYRLVKSIPPNSDDFLSQKQERLNRGKTDEPASWKSLPDSCMKKGVSVYSEKEGAERQKKKVKSLRKRKVFKLFLRPKDGLIKQTGGDPQHHTWWRSEDFDIEDHKQEGDEN